MFSLHSSYSHILSSEHLLYNFLIKCSNSYYNSGTSLISDHDFDLLVDHYNTTYNKSFNYLGKANMKKSKLPVWMGSLDKVKTNHQLSLFFKKLSTTDSIAISPKFDGISLLIDYNHSPPKLLKRGDGNIGSDITHLSDFINFPKNINYPLIVRGELIIKKSTYYNNYHSIGSNPRNFVSGIVNSKKIEQQKLSSCDFFAYKLYDLSEDKKYDNLSYVQSLEILQQFGFTTHYNNTMHSVYQINSKQLNEQHLTTIVKTLKNTIDYDIDGIVLSSCNQTKEIHGENPKYQVAFKIQNDSVNVIVDKVEWNLSRYGVFCPKVIIQPTIVCGVNITNITAHNAKFVKDNGIGPGAVISITRSNDVIPDITDVITKVEPQFPTDDYIWDSVNIIKVNKDNTINQDQLISQLTFMLSTLDAKGISESTVKKFVMNQWTTLEQLLQLDKNQLLQLPGIKDKSSEKIYQALSIAKSNITLEKLMLGSSIFKSFGIKKIQQSLSSMPSLIQFLFNKIHLEKQLVITTLNKASIVTLAEDFYNYCILFKNQYLQPNSYFYNILYEKYINTTTSTTSTTSSNITRSNTEYVLLTGFRDNRINNYAKQVGWIIQDNFTTKTTMLVVKDINKSSTKLTKAYENNIKILTLQDFEKYLDN